MIDRARIVYLLCSWGVLDQRGDQLRPFTLDDLVALTAENGNTAEGLDLSGLEIEAGIDLSDMDLRGIVFKDCLFGAVAMELRGSFQVQDGGGELLMSTAPKVARSEPVAANLEGADARWADFRGAHIEFANFRNADLTSAKLEGAYLRNALVTDATHLEDVE